MAKRLIDADALKAEIDFIRSLCNDKSAWVHVYITGLSVAKDATDWIPTVDAVEVVRCKDCIHYVSPEDEDFLGECKNGRLAVSQSGEIYPEENYYCAYGERRTDGNL